MSAQHTPGPWHWDSDPIKGDPLGRVRFQVTTIGKTIAQTYYSSSDKHAEADTRLIAAAPDLLAALEDSISALRAALDQEIKNDAREEWLSIKRKRLDAARAAIAKATGEDS